MAGISVVQSVTVTDAASGSFGTATTAGNTVVVVVTCAQTGNVAMSVSGVTLGGAAGNFGQAESSQSGYAGGFTEFAAAWVDPGCAGGQTAVAVSGTNLALTGGTDNGFTAYEVAGLVPSSSLAAVLDQSQPGSGTTGTAVSSGTTGTTAQAAEIAFAGLAGGATLSSFTSGWTVAGINDGSGEYNAAGYKVLAATGAQSLAATQASSGPWAGVIVTLRGYVPPPGSPALIPPGISSPMNFRRRAVPSQAPPLVAAGESGTGADTGTVTASASSADAGFAAEGATAQPGASDTDTGHGTEAGSVTSASISGTDTGSGAEAGGPVVNLSGTDTGTAAESAAVTVRPLLTVRWNAPDRLNRSGGTMGGT